MDNVDKFEIEEITSNVALQLYTLPNSEDCNVVKNTIYSLGIPFNEKDAIDGAVMRELVSIQRNEEVPFLYNTTTEKKISGRKAIVEFLDDKYSEEAISHLL